MNTQELISALLRGDYDNDLDAIRSVARDREKQLAAAHLYTLSVGDTVTINRSVRPKYLAGAPGTIVTHMGDKVQIRLDPAWLALNPRARRYDPCTVSAALVAP